jgi:hypothetical protein
MLLLLEITLIPTSHRELPEIAVNPSSVIPSAVNVIAFLFPPTSTIGLPIPVIVTDFDITTFS